MSINVSYNIPDLLEDSRNLYTYIFCPGCKKRFLVSVIWLEKFLTTGIEIECPNKCKLTLKGEL